MRKPKLLDSIKLPDDLKKLSLGQLEQLCGDVRELLIQTVSENGGHLASNLGVVELTVALHRVFDFGKSDQIVWDVGHQSYTHKILTGRKEQFATIRKKGGLSGFPRRSESSYDAFLSGHSSTSISAALGLAEAKKLKGDDGCVVAVFGDGAFTNGLVFEAFNNAWRENKQLILILNDNEMSISKNVGSLAKYLSTIRTKPEYFKAKDALEKTLQKIPLCGEKLRDAVAESKNRLKGLIYHTTFFEDFGFDYLGPVAGHDLNVLCDVLTRAKRMNRPVLVHVETIKGKGYRFAEQNPGAFHGVSKFNVDTGDADLSSENSFSAEFGRYLAQLGREDKSICAITAAMKYGTGLQYFSQAFKGEGRFFDVGIAESHAVTFAAGLAANGMKPVFAVYSSFLQRSYDQVLHDACIEPQHLVLAVDRAGLVGEDGETHQGVFDVAFLSTIPNLRIYSPVTYFQLRRCLEHCLFQLECPCVIRYPRGREPELDSGVLCSFSEYDFYGDEQGEVLLLTYGRELGQVLSAQKLLQKEGMAVSTANLLHIKPLPESILKRAQNFQKVVFVEEGIRQGGVGQQLGCLLLEHGFAGRYAVRAIDDCFVRQGSVEEQLQELRLDADSIAEFVKRELGA